MATRLRALPYVHIFLVCALCAALACGPAHAEVTADPVLATTNTTITSGNITTENNTVTANTLTSVTENTALQLDQSVPTLSMLATKKPAPAPVAKEMPKEGAGQGQYPKLNIEGYKEYEFMKMEKEGDPLQYENDSTYKDAAAKIAPTAGSAGLLRERLRLDIEGKLSEKLSVSYHLEQEPDLPDKFDIKVRYDKTELMFGDFTAGFQTKEFVNFSKAVNGFQLTSYDNWYDLKIVTAKEKSTAKEVSFQGTGLSTYSLGQTSILEGSVKVYVNDLRVNEGTDYTIDYFEGKITFKTIKSSGDKIVVQYEFTDPIEDLIPVATKVDFFGLQGTLRTFEEPRREKAVITVEQKLQSDIGKMNARLLGPEVPTQSQAKENVPSQTIFYLEGTPIVFGSEEIMLNNRTLRLNEDYLLNYDSGELKMLKRGVLAHDVLSVRYQYNENKKLAETWNGKESKGPYPLGQSPVRHKSVQVFLDGQKLVEGTDYIVDYQKGEILFSLPVSRTQKVTVEYAYMIIRTAAPAERPQEAFSLQSTYLKETADSGQRGENLVSNADDTDGSIVVSQDGTLIILDQSKLPIKEDSLSTIIVDGVAYAGTPNIEGYRGYIFVSPSIASSASVELAYDYYKTNILPLQTYAAGSGMSELILENQNNKYLPVVYHSEEVYRRWYNTSTGLWQEDALRRGENYVWGPLTVSADGTLVQNDLEEYWSRGYITFVTKNASNTWVPWQIKSGEQIKIKYCYAPGEQPDFGRITHQVYGINTQYMINPNWMVGLEAMKSEKTYNLAVLDARWSSAGTGVYGGAYTVSPIVTDLGVVENSEQVYLYSGTVVSGSETIQGTLQSRNDDYVINYKRGEIRFKNGKNPGASDNIIVKYKYYSNTDSNGNELKAQNKQGTAYKASTAVKTGAFTVASNVMNIETDFETIGSMRQQPGTKLGDIGVVYQPDRTFRLGTFVENKHLLMGSRDNNEPWYQSSYFQKHDTFWEFLPRQTLELNFQQTDTVKESQLSTSKNFDIDTIDRNYGGRLTFGPDFFRTMYEGKRSESLADVLDKKDRLSTVGSFHHVNNVYRPWNILSFTTDYQHNLQDADIHPWTIETNNKYQETIDYLPYSNWSNKLDYSKQLIEKETQTAPRRSTESITELTNYFYATTLTRPNDWTDPFFSEFYTHFDRNYAQGLNPLLDQSPDTEDKDNFNQSLRPWDLFKLSWDATRYNAIKGNELDLADKYTHKTSFEDFRPLKLWQGSPLAQDFFIVERVSYGEGVYNRSNRLASTTTSGNSTFETNYTYDVGLRMNPLNFTVLKYTYTEGNQQTMYDILYHKDADTTFTDRPQNKRTYGLSYTPGTIVMPVLFTPGLTLTNTGFWADRSYSSVIDESHHWVQASPTETVTKKNLENFEDKQSLKFNPLPSLALDMTRKDTSETLFQTGVGSRESLGLLHNMKWTNDIPTDWGTFQLFGYFQGDRAVQYTSPSEDMDLEDLHGEFSTYFYRLDEQQNYGLGYTPFAQLTLRSSYTNEDILQQSLNSDPTTENAIGDELYINSKIYSAGLEYRPFSGMRLSYDWDMKRFVEGDGERITIKARYQPFDWLLGHCVFNYEYVHNSGFGLNDIDQMIAQNQQLGYIATTVQKVSNERMTGSLDLQILNDINSVVIEGTEVVATWTLIRLVDKMNADNNYSVNAFYLKGRIVF